MHRGDAPARIPTPAAGPLALARPFDSATQTASILSAPLDRLSLCDPGMTAGYSVTIAELLSSSRRPTATEAVAITTELCDRIRTQQAPAAVPPAVSLSTVRIDASGSVSVVGGVPSEDDQAVSLVGRLLLEMLMRAGEKEGAVPARLVALAARAASEGTRAYASLAYLIAALARYAPPDRHPAIRALFERWHSDCRRPVRMEPYRATLPLPVSRPPRTFRLRPCGTRTSRWLTAVLLAGAALLLLAGTGVLELGGRPGPVPAVPPGARPVPASPRREHGWELLGKPQRVAGLLAPGPPARQLPGGGTGVASDPAPSEPGDPVHASPAPPQLQR